MSVLAASILFSGIALQVCLLVLLLSKRGGRVYVYLSICAIWSLFRTLLAVSVLFAGSPAEYARVYWITDSIDVLVRFLVVAELARHIFPNGSSVAMLLSQRLRVLGTAALMLGVSTFWSYQAYISSHSMRTAMERSASFSQAVMTLTLLIAARYYGIPLGPQLRAIAFAFGIWTSIGTINNAVIDLEHSFLPYWQIVRPLSFVALIGAWNWALWKLSPDPEGVESPLPVPELDLWTQHWNRTQSALRRIKQS